MKIAYLLGGAQTALPGRLGQSGRHVARVGGAVRHAADHFEHTVVTLIRYARMQESEYIVFLYQLDTISCYTLYTIYLS